jgi:hypothetical protein
MSGKMICSSDRCNNGMEGREIDEWNEEMGEVGIGGVRGILREAL